MKAIKVRVVKTATRSAGSGVRESFWEVQKKGTFKWRIVGVFPSSEEALTRAHQIVSV